MTNEKFISLSKHYATKYLMETTELWISSGDIFVVWLSKALQNWKCLIGTRATDHYFEFTYNGDSKELYMDVYRQESGGNTFTVDGE